MPRGDKSKYTGKQVRQADHIEEGYGARGVTEPEAQRRAWATVNKETGGSKKAGSGRGKPEDHAPARKGGNAAANSEVPAGQNVLIAVTDTGTGLPPDVVARAFDPFFTTKAEGLTTGLGLSQVYGFIQAVSRSY